jgi:hypothetical protein
VGDGVLRKELDFLDNSITKFVLNNDALYYRIMNTDIPVPDNISFKVYGEERLWWVLCLVNQINNIAADMAVGTLITVPNMLDIYDFYKRFRKR